MVDHPLLFDEEIQGTQTCANQLRNIYRRGFIDWRIIGGDLDETADNLEDLIASYEGCSERQETV